MSALSGNSSAGTIALGGATLTVDQSTHTLFAGALEGTGGFVKRGTGTLTLSGDSSAYTGSTSVRGGALHIEGALGGDVTVEGNETVGSALNAAASNALGGTLRLNNYGHLNLLADDALSPTTHIVFAGGSDSLAGTFALNGHDATVGRLSVLDLGAHHGLVTNRGAQDSTLTIDAASTDSFFRGVIENGGGGGRLGLRLKAGILRLVSLSTYTGGTTVEGGTLVAHIPNAFVNNTSYVVNGGTLALNNNNLTMSSLAGNGGGSGSDGVVALGSAALTINQTADTHYAGIFTGTGSLIKSGTGRLTLSNASGNSRWGGTRINAGTLDIDGGHIRGTANDPVVVGTGGSTAALAVRNGGTADFSAGGASPKLIIGYDGTGSAIVTGAGSLLNVGGGRLQVGEGGLAASLDIADGARVQAASTHVSGTSAAPSTQVATLNLRGTPGARGVLETGRLEAGVGGDRNDDATASLVFDGGVLRATQDQASFLHHFQADEARIDGGGAFIDTDGHAIGIASQLSGAGGLTQQGTGTLTLSTAQSYTGATTVESGTLALAGAGSIAASAGLTLNSGSRYDISATSGSLIRSLSGSGDIALGGQALTVTGGGSFGGAISGSGGSLIKQGGNTLALTGISSHTGPTLVEDGTLLVNGAIAGSAVSVHNGATLAGGGSVGSTTVADGGRLAAGNSIGALTVDGSLTLSPDAILDFELGAPGASGNPALGKSDRIVVAHDLAFDGTVNLAQSGDPADGTAALGYYRLLTYGGTLTRNTARIGSTPPLADADLLELQAGNGRVDLFVAAVGDDTLQHWQGGSGFWSADSTHWQNQGGGIPVPWAGKHAVFKDTGGFQGGTITVQDAQPFEGIQFVDEGYRLEGPGPLVTNAAGSEIRVLANRALIATPITGSGSLHKTDAGTLVLTGTASHGGGTVIQSGTLQVGAGGTTGALAGNVANHGTLAFRRGDALTFAGAISGSGQLRQEGGGRLTLSGDSGGYTGSTTVAGGTLAVNGRLGGALEVAAPGRLEGTGTVGSISVAGTLAPGNSIGTLHVEGDLVFHPGSTYEAEVEPGGAADRVVATGRVTLHGGGVRVQNAPGTYALGSRYTLLTAAGGLSGRFDGLSQALPFGTPFLSFGLNYGPDAAYLDVGRSAVSFASVARTPNQHTVGASLDRLSLASPLVAAAAQLDALSAGPAFDRLSGSLHASLRTALIEDSRHVRAAALGRLRAAQGGPGVSTPGTPASASAAPSPSALQAGTAAGPVFWSQAYGSWGSTDGDGNAASLKRRSAGLLLGVDGEIGRWRVGMLAGYGQSRVREPDHGASSSSRDIHLGVYGGTSLGPLSLRMGAAYARHALSTHRQIGLADLGGPARADYRGHTLQAFGELAHQTQLGGLRLEPYANIAHVRLRTGGFAEAGGATALRGAKATQRLTFATLGLRGEHEFTLGGMPATVSGTLGWRHAFGRAAPDASLRFAGGDAHTVAGVPIARNSAVVEAGLGLQLSRQATLAVSYAGQIASGARDHGVRAMLSARF